MSKLSAWRRATSAAATALTLLGVERALAQEVSFIVSGAVRGLAGEPLAGAVVSVEGGGEAMVGPDGGYRLAAVPGERTLCARLSGYRAAVRQVAVEAHLDGVDFRLEPALRAAGEIVVSALRADERAPVTKREIPAEELERRNYGQEMPFLLAETPGVTSYSETGLQLGAGYSYFTLRGLHQTRINMTFDGVPLNDPEESAVYFANFGDFSSALGSIQVQRGVGTSTVGSASYGGAINFASLDLLDEAETAIEVGVGSYGTQRASVAYQSGRLGPHLALYGRASFQETSGYRESSGVRQRTLFLGGEWRGEETYLRFFGFSGRERTNLSFYAVEPEILEEAPRFNPMRPEEDDAFGQDVVYVYASRPLGGSVEIGAQLYYNGAQGGFDLWDDPAAGVGLRHYGIDGHTLGALVTATAGGERWKLRAGLHGYEFERDHFQLLAGVRQYENSGHKWEVSGFAKLGYDLAPRWHLFGDLQLRHTEFRYDGSVDLGPIHWTFVNPKLGVRYLVSERLSFYASVGRAEREPVRNDLLVGEDNVDVAVDLEAVQPEEVVDVELGVEFVTPRLRLAVDLFAMEFRNEIAATGEQSEIGYAIRRNVPESTRRGIELDFAWRPTPELRLQTSALLADNRIARWRQALDVYDELGNYLTSELREFRDTPPTLSPETILRSSIEWQALPDIWLSLAARYVGRAYLDNTGQEKLSTPSYTWTDAAVRLGLARWLPWGAPELRLQANNLLDEKNLWPSGYSYPYLVRHGIEGDELTGIPYYYPLAGRHFFAGLELRF